MKSLNLHSFIVSKAKEGRVKEKMLSVAAASWCACTRSNDSQVCRSVQLDAAEEEQPHVPLLDPLEVFSPATRPHGSEDCGR